jgi:DNA-binding HxlR family transcriptional regulator
MLEAKHTEESGADMAAWRASVKEEAEGAVAAEPAATGGSGCCALRSCAGKSYFCSVELALQVIGGKWKPIILWHLRTGERLRFGELKRQMPNVTQKMLTQQLRELESDGMILRKVYPQVPPKVEYSLTCLGRSVLPVLGQLSSWGALFEAEHQGHGGCGNPES